MNKHKYAKHDELIDRGLETFSLQNKLLKEINFKNNKNLRIKILEIGCGKGVVLCQLNNMFKNLELHGLNLNATHGVKTQKDFIINARKKGITLNTKNLPYIHFGDATKLKFENNSFDIIISQVTFLHIKNKAKAIQEVYRTLKTDGVALISLGAYAIRIGKKDNTPKFYNNLNKLLGKDYNPRFLIKKDNKYIKISKFINSIIKQYNIQLWTNAFTSKTQKAKGFWLIIRKEKNDKLNLNLKYLKDESKNLNLKYAKKNPVNFGVIDVYDLK
ncbi:MAG: class I SAM-dependent methyltransferase [Candidatus Woesearchaeota archaeon]